MGIGGSLTILFQVVSLQLVDLLNVLNSLLLKELQLLLKGLVPRGLQQIEPLLLLVILFLQVIDGLLLQSELMLDLSHLALVLLLQLIVVSLKDT